MTTDSAGAAGTGRPPLVPAPLVVVPAVPEGSAAWGRVGPDGTVLVRTTTGERPVGSYPGATPEEALAYFTRKYDELAGRVRLLAQRAAAGGLAPEQSAAAITRLQQEVDHARAVGDLAALQSVLEGVRATATSQASQREAERSRSRDEARQAKEALVAQAGSVAAAIRRGEGPDARTAARTLAELVDRWKSLPRLDRRTDDALWSQFRAARAEVDVARRAAAAAYAHALQEALARKQELVRQADQLAASTEWAPAAARWRELMEQWKVAGRAPRADEERLWARFRAAQDAFFAARNAAHAERDTVLTSNLEAKEAIAAEAEALLPVVDANVARTRVRALEARWDETGPVPRAAQAGLETRMRRVVEAITAADTTAWRRGDPAIRARAEATIQQLHEAIDAWTRKAQAARTRGDARAVVAAEEAVTARRAWLVEAEKTL
ncbi:MAG: DUF349 domain-containing protein, partial [Actinomycetes bacterium]